MATYVCVATGGGGGGGGSRECADLRLLRRDTWGEISIRKKVPNQMAVYWDPTREKQLVLVRAGGGRAAHDRAVVAKDELGDVLLAVEPTLPL